MTIEQITTLPQPPVKTDPVNFAERADTFLGSLPPFVVETNVAINGINSAAVTCAEKVVEAQGKVDECEDIRVLANGHKIDAESAANTALLSANATIYNNATTYNINDIVIGSNGGSYICLVNGTVGDDPVSSVTGNWSVIVPNISGGVNNSILIKSSDDNYTFDWKYTNVNYQHKTDNFTAEYTYVYFITPTAETNITATLPTSNKIGYVGFRLDNADENRKLLINPTSTHSIENNVNGVGVVIDTVNLLVYFSFDGTTWRIS